jgi:hypothetical protein
MPKDYTADYSNVKWQLVFVGNNTNSRENALFPAPQILVCQTMLTLYLL